MTRAKSYPFNFNNTIAYRLIGYIFLFSSLITLLTTSLQLYQDYQKDVVLINERIAQIGETQLDSIIQSVWDINVNMLRIQLDGILRLPNIQQVEIRQNEKLIASAGTLHSQRTIQRQFPLIYFQKGVPFPLGTLMITASLDDVYLRLKDRIVFILIAQSVKTFLVSFFIFFLFYFLIGRHLHTIAAYTRSLDMNLTNPPLTLNRRRNKPSAADELDQMVFAINEMNSNLKNLYESLGKTIEALNENIAERKQAEDTLRESKKNLMAIMNTPSYAIMVHDRNGIIMEINDTVLKRFNRGENELIGKCFWELLPSSVSETRKAKAEQVFRTGLPVRFQDEREGLWSDIVLNPITNDSGEVVKIAAIGWDITEQKQTEEQFKIIFEMALDMICIADIHTATFTKINPAFTRILGYSEDELLNRSFLSFIHPDDVEKTIAIIETALKKGISIISFENRYRCKDGSYRHLDWNSHPILEKGITFAIAHDITDRKKTEAEIHRLNEELEARVRRRTDQLEASNRELESFCYSLSHDLRTPLRGIDGWSQAIAEDYADKLDTQGIKYLERIRSESQRMARLIDDLLDLSHLTRINMSVAPINLSELAQTILAQFRAINPNRTVECLIHPNLIVHADPEMMNIALTNLIQNAWKFTGKRSVSRIEFGKLETDASGRQVFFIKDNGVGFDMAYVKKLFNPFQRLHKASEFPGTGIGLAIVHRIINRHGGRVWAEGAVNAGAVFYFML